MVALYRWPLVQVPLYFNEGFQRISVCNFRTQFSGENFYARGRALFEQMQLGGQLMISVYCKFIRKAGKDV